MYSSQSRPELTPGDEEDSDADEKDEHIRPPNKKRLRSHHDGADDAEANSEQGDEKPNKGKGKEAAKGAPSPSHSRDTHQTADNLSQLAVRQAAPAGAGRATQLRRVRKFPCVRSALTSLSR
jgi:hypothetical protein